MCIADGTGLKHFARAQAFEQHDCTSLLGALVKQFCKNFAVQKNTSLSSTVVHL